MGSTAARPRVEGTNGMATLERMSRLVYLQEIEEHFKGSKELAWIVGEYLDQSILTEPCTAWGGLARPTLDPVPAPDGWPFWSRD